MPEQTNETDDKVQKEIQDAATKVHKVLIKEKSITARDVVAYVLIFLLGLQAQDPETYNAVMDTLKANEAFIKSSEACIPDEN